MAVCPIFSFKEVRDDFNSIVKKFGGTELTLDEFKKKELRNERKGIDYIAMDIAYYLWDQYNGEIQDIKNSTIFKLSGVISQMLYTTGNKKSAVKFLNEKKNILKLTKEEHKEILSLINKVYKDLSYKQNVIIIPDLNSNVQHEIVDYLTQLVIKKLIRTNVSIYEAFNSIMNHFFNTIQNNYNVLAKRIGVVNIDDYKRLILEKISEGFDAESINNKINEFSTQLDDILSRYNVKYLEQSIKSILSKYDEDVFYEALKDIPNLKNDLGKNYRNFVQELSGLKNKIIIELINEKVENELLNKSKDLLNETIKENVELSQKELSNFFLFIKPIYENKEILYNLVRLQLIKYENAIGIEGPSKVMNPDNEMLDEFEDSDFENSGFDFEFNEKLDYGKSNFEKEIKLSAAVKRLFFGLDSGEKTSFGSVKFVNPFTAQSVIKSILRDSSFNYYTMITLLNKETGRFPWIKELIQRLEQSDSSVKNAFANQMYMHYCNQYQVFYDPQSYHSVLVRINDLSTIRNILNTWFSSFSLSEYVKNGLVLSEKLVQDYVTTEKKIQDLVEQEKYVEALNEFKSFSLKLGINLSDEIFEIEEDKVKIGNLEIPIDKLLSTKKLPFKVLFDNVVEYKNNIQNLYIFNLRQLFNGKLFRKIAEIEISKNPALTPVSHNAGNKKLYSYTWHSYLSQFAIKLLNNQDGIVNSLLSVPYYKNNIWLNKIIEGELTKENFSIGAVSIEAIKEFSSKYTGDKKLGSLSQLELELYLMTTILYGVENSNNQKLIPFNMITTSDKSSYYTITTLPFELEYNNDGTISEKTIDKLFEISVLPEIERMLHARNLIISKKEITENLKTGSFIFYLVPELNFIKELWDENGYIRSDIKSNTELLNKMKQVLKKSLLADIENRKNFITENKLLQYVKVENLDSNIRNKLDLHNEETLLNYVASEVTTQNYFSYATIYTSLVHDFAYMFKPKYFKEIFSKYKNTGKTNLQILRSLDKIEFSSGLINLQDDYNKRAAMFIANGRLNVISSDEKVRYLVANDKQAVSLMFDQLKEYLDKSAESYTKKGALSEATNAQEFITLEEYLTILYNDGKISNNLYNAAKEFFNKNRGENYNENYYDDLLNHFKEKEVFDEYNKLVIGSTKPVYNWFELDKNFGIAPIYFKTSAYPIMPNINNVKINKLRILLEKNGIDRLVFNSGAKLKFTEKSANIFDENGNIVSDLNPEELKEASKELPREGLRINQDVPNHGFENKINRISQADKNLFADLLNVGGFYYNGNYYTGRQLAEKYFELYDKLYEIKKNQLIKELEIKTDDSGNIIEFNIDKLRNILLEEAIKRDYPLNDISALNSEKGLKTLAFLPSAKKLEALINSIIKNQILKIKFPGNSFVLSTEEGYESETRQDLNSIGNQIQDSVDSMDSVNSVNSVESTEYTDIELDEIIIDRLNKLYPEIELIFTDEDLENLEINGLVYLQLSDKKRKEFEEYIKKKRPNLTESVDTILDGIDQFLTQHIPENKHSKIANLLLKWVIEGTVLMPEDSEKVLQAIKIGEQKNLDMFRYNSPNEIIESFSHVKLKERIDPDTLKTFTNKKDIGNGIVLYDVEDSKEGQRDARKIVDTHFGEDSNPWCVLSRDENGLTERSWRSWSETYKGPKKIAFKNGRLIAFYAGELWWNRLGISGKGIPIIVKLKGDPLKRSQIVEVSDEDTNVILKERKIFKGNKRNGTYEEWYSDGTKMLEEHRENNALEGVRKRWYENGQLAELSNYKNEKKHGLYQEWYKNGQLRIRVNYIDGKLDGLYQGWHENGKLEESVNYENGLRQGLYQRWHENGKLEESVNYENGEKEGLYRKWHDNGKLKVRGNYKNGKEHGLYEYWSEDGKLLIHTNYKDGERHGLHKEWYPDGKLAVLTNYKDGKEHGLREEWYENGRLKKLNYNKNGLLDGLYQRWYPNGQLEQSINYKNDERDGLYQAWYPNGKLSISVNYKNDKKEGLYQSWNYDGTLVESIIYKDDKEVNVEIQKKDEETLRYQKLLENKIAGIAAINALKIYISSKNRRIDTVPHEYAHFYIHWFRNTPIVQEAIKKWGSEEALVQAIGERVVKQKGEAWDWWNKFLKWIHKIFNNLSVLSKEDLLHILTDAFLTRQDLNNIFENRSYSTPQQNSETSQEIYNKTTQKIEFKKQNVFTVNPIKQVDEKAKAKASISNKFIGFAEGITGSSTAEYAKQISAQVNGNTSQQKQKGKIDIQAKMSKFSTEISSPNYIPEGKYIDLIHLYEKLNRGEKIEADDFPPDVFSSSQIKNIIDVINEQFSTNNTQPISTKDKPIQIYTDGSDIKGTGKIGTGIYIEHNGKEYKKSNIHNVEDFKNKYNIDTNVSNPTMEIAALVEALTEFKDRGEHLVIYSDYEGVQKWVSGEWKVKQPYIKDLVDQAKALIAQIEKNGGSVQLKWVRGHSGVKGNEKVDAVAKDRNVYNTIPELFKTNQTESTNTSEVKDDVVNSGTYGPNDVVFVSIPGKRGNTDIRKEQQDKTIEEALKAIEAGATLITDNKSYIEKSDYNEGEKRLAEVLESKGYNYYETVVDGHTLGVWKKGTSLNKPEYQSKTPFAQFGDDFKVKNNFNNVKTIESVSNRLKQSIVYTPSFTGSLNPGEFVDENGNRLFGEELKKAVESNRVIVKKPAQVIVPWKFAINGKVIDMSKYIVNGKIDTSLIDPSVLELFGARIPNAGLNSQSYIEIVGFLPPNFGDIIIASRDYLAQMGSDFDVDKLYTYSSKLFVYDNKIYAISEKNKELYEKVLKDSIESFDDNRTEFAQYFSSKEDLIHELDIMEEDIIKNEIKEIHNAIIKNTYPLVVKKNLYPTDYWKFKEISDNIRKSRANLNPVISDYYHTSSRKNASSGKELVSVFAVFNTLLPLLQYAKIGLNNSKNKRVINFGNYHADFYLENTHTVKNKNLLKSTVLNALLQSAVDNQNQQILGPLGININNVNAAITLVLLGFDEEIGYFFNIPAIKEFYEHLEKLKNDPVYKYYNDENLMRLAFEFVVSKYTNMHTEGVSENVLFKSFENRQGIIFVKEYLNLSLKEIKEVALNGDKKSLSNLSALYMLINEIIPVTGKLQSISKITRTDSTFLKTSYAKLFQQFHEYIETRDKLIESGHFGLFNKNIPESANNHGLMFAYKLYNSFYGKSSILFKKFFYSILKTKTNQTINEQDYEIIWNFFLNAVYANEEVLGKNVNERRKELLDLNSENNILKSINEFKKLYPQNLFLQSININIEEKNHYIELTVPIVMNEVSSEIYKSVLELYNYPDGEKIIKDIIDYCIVSGNVNGFNSLMNYIPFSILNETGLIDRLDNFINNTENIEEKEAFLERIYVQLCQYYPKFSVTVSENAIEEKVINGKVVYTATNDLRSYISTSKLDPTMDILHKALVVRKDKDYKNVYLIYYDSDKIETFIYKLPILSNVFPDSSVGLIDTKSYYFIKEKVPYLFNPSNIKINNKLVTVKFSDIESKTYKNNEIYDLVNLLIEKNNKDTYQNYLLNLLNDSTLLKDITVIVNNDGYVDAYFSESTNTIYISKTVNNKESNITSIKTKIVNILIKQAYKVANELRNEDFEINYSLNELEKLYKQYKHIVELKYKNKFTEYIELQKRYVDAVASNNEERYNAIKEELIKFAPSEDLIRMQAALSNDNFMALSISNPNFIRNTLNRINYSNNENSTIFEKFVSLYSDLLVSLGISETSSFVKDAIMNSLVVFDKVVINPESIGVQSTENIIPSEEQILKKFNEMNQDGTQKMLAADTKNMDINYGIMLKRADKINKGQPYYKAEVKTVKIGNRLFYKIELITNNKVNLESVTDEEIKDRKRTCL